MRIEVGDGRTISTGEARQALSDLFGTDIGPVGTFMVAAHREDGIYIIGGSLSCQHCRAGFLIDAAMQVLGDAPHEQDHPEHPAIFPPPGDTK